MRAHALPVLAALLALAACAGADKKPEEEPSKDTFECTLTGERYVVRFTDAEARMLLPGGTRVVLYQIPAASGVRYTNGSLELRGRGMELQIVEDGYARSLEGCKPVMVPKQETPWYERMAPPPRPSTMP